jgi:hypothetical protein
MRANVNATVAHVPNRAHTPNLVSGQIMWRTLLLLAGVAVLFPATGLAFSAPAQLLGKSVAVSWTDMRDMSFEDGPHVSRTYLSNLKVYSAARGARSVSSPSPCKLLAVERHQQSASRLQMIRDLHAVTLALFISKVIH